MSIEEFMLDNSKTISDTVENLAKSNALAEKLVPHINSELAMKIYKLIAQEKIKVIDAASTLAMLAGSMTMVPGQDAKQRAVFANALCLLILRLADIPQEMVDKNPLMSKKGE